MEGVKSLFIQDFLFHFFYQLCDLSTAFLEFNLLGKVATSTWFFFFDRQANNFIKK